MNMNDIQFQHVWLICIKTVSFQHGPQSYTRPHSSDTTMAQIVMAQELDTSCLRYHWGRGVRFQLPAFMSIMTCIQRLM